MKNLKFNYKFIIISFSFILSIFIFSNNSYADVEVIQGENHYTLPDLPIDTGESYDYNHCANFFIVISGNNNINAFFHSNNSLRYYPRSSGGIFNMSTYSAFAFNRNTNSWDFSYTTTRSGQFNLSADSSIIYSTLTIAIDGSSSYYFILGENDGIFPLVVETVEETALLRVEQLEEIPTKIMEAIQTIIPIGLVVLSIFLVIFLIRLVISRVI